MEKDKAELKYLDY
jgi:hypothetical protein